MPEVQLGRDRAGTSTAATVPDPFSQPGSLGVWYGHVIRREHDDRSPLRETSRLARPCFFLVPTGKSYFVAGDSNHVASFATATREYAAATAATNKAYPTSSCHTTRDRPLAVPLQPHTTPASTAPPTRPAPTLPPWFRRSGNLVLCMLVRVSGAYYPA